MPDQQPSPQESSDTISFNAFVLSLATTAAVHFGDMPDPVTGKPGEPNLEAASQMIDILALLELNTRGNLTAEERTLLTQVLYELRLRYVGAEQGQKRIIVES